MTTMSRVRASSWSSAAMASDDSSSLGFGGRGPAASTCSPPSPTGWVTSRSEPPR